MKTAKLTIFLFLVLFISNINAQDTYTWTGDMGNNWQTPLNWIDSDGNPPFNYPAENDTAIFEGIINTINLPPSLSNAKIAKLIISDISNIHFQNGYMTVTEDFSLDDSSEISLTTLSPNSGHLIISGNATVSGIINTNNNSGVFPGSANAEISFESGSRYIAGENLTNPYSIGSYSNSNTVFFRNGSTYEHRGGASPVNDTGNNDVVVFEPESNYEIHTTETDNIKLGGNTFGNIRVFEDVDYSNNTANQTLTFNDLYINDNKQFQVQLQGNNTNIIITGDTVNNGGNSLYLEADSAITFNNEENPVVIQGNAANPIFFSVTNTGTGHSFAFVEENAELILETEVQISGASKYYVHGTIDFTVNFQGTLSLQYGSLIKTSFNQGFSGLTLDATGEETLEFYGSSDQEIGISGGANVKQIILNKDAGSKLNLYFDCETDTLTLKSGIFNIYQKTLKVTEAINYEGGTLEGNIDYGSRLEIGSITSNDFILQTPLSLSDLAVNSNIFLNGGGLLEVNDSLELNSGNLNIMGSDLKLGDEIDISSPFDEDFSESYIIADDAGVVKKVFSQEQANATAIPIGTSSYLSAVSIVPETTSEYSINVFNNVYPGGYYSSGSQTYPYVLDMTWNISSDDNNAATLQIYWEEYGGIEGEEFISDNAYISYFDEISNTWSEKVNETIPTPPNLLPSMANVLKSISNNGLFCVASQVINNAPVAEDQEFDVARYSPAGTYIGELIASDPDTGQTLSFSVPGNISAIYIEENSIYVGDSAALANAPNNSYTIVATVCDNGVPVLCSNFNLTLNIYNPVPVADNQEFTIPEHSPKGFEVGQVGALEIHSGTEVVFEFFQPNTTFNLTRSGIITVNNSDDLEYSINQVFNIPVKIYYQGMPSNYSLFNLIIHLTEISPDNLFVSNYISPNGDGINDTWVIRGGEEKYSVKVFNKAGNLVFKSDNYQSRWDGNSRGNNLSPGVYYYIISSKNNVKKGTITLVR